MAAIGAIFGPYDFVEQFLGFAIILVIVGAWMTSACLAGLYAGQRFGRDDPDGLRGAVIGLVGGFVGLYFALGPVLDFLKGLLP